MIKEFNQEQCRVQSYDGKSSLIRSFPSKVGVKNHAIERLERPLGGARPVGEENLLLSKVV
jgi:hypothetical protein